MPSAVDEIKARIDIVDLVTESGVQLRRSGRNYTGFCPFHENKRTPSFAVWPETGTWYCFGECGEGGDVFSFVMKKQGMDFREALEYLAEKAGVDLAAYRREPAARQAHDHLYALLEEATLFYHNLLLHSPAGAEALRYLREERGLQPETIEAFGLGYAPSGWDNTLRHFQQRGYKAEDLLAVGLVRQRQSGAGHYDTFRHRLMIPIRDVRGRVVGFGARALSAEEAAKYINSPQTALFNKSDLLYGLYEARRAIRQDRQAVIVEGYMDVIGLHQAGYRNAVAPMGTALTSSQFRLLKRFARRVVLALDPDEAGRKAILRGLDAARSLAAEDQEQQPTFNPRGFLRLESSFGLDLRVLSLPEGQDPDELVLADAARWETLLAEARPIVQYVMETLAAEEDLADPRAKAAIARRVLPLIYEVVDTVERAGYLQRLARLLDLSEEVLLTYRPQGQEAAPVRRRRSPRPSAQTARRSAPVTPRPRGVQPEALEEFVLNALYFAEEVYWQVNQMLAENQCGHLEAGDFEQALHRQAFLLLLAAQEQIETDWRAYVQQHADPYLQEAVDRWQRVPYEAVSLRDLVSQTCRTILQLRRLRVDREIDEKRRLLAAGQVSLNEFQQLASRRARIDHALAEKDMSS